MRSHIARLQEDRRSHKLIKQMHLSLGRQIGVQAWLYVRATKRYRDRELMLRKIARVTVNSIDATARACGGHFDLERIYRQALRTGKLPTRGNENA